MSLDQRIDEQKVEDAYDHSQSPHYPAEGEPGGTDHGHDNFSIIALIESAFTSADRTKFDQLDPNAKPAEAVKADTADSVEYANVQSKPATFPPETHTHSEIPESLEELNEDTGHRTVSDIEKTTWNAKMKAPIFSATPPDPTGLPQYQMWIQIP